MLKIFVNLSFIREYGQQGPLRAYSLPEGGIECYGKGRI